MKIVFQNQRFVAVDKPAGFLSVPGRTGEKDPRPCLSHELARFLQSPVLPVHRLDAEVSGLILFARDSEAHRAANLWFESRGVRKTYEAWTEGNVSEDARGGQMVEWTSTLLRGKKRAYESPHGKSAITHARWLGERDDKGARVQQWSLEPLTGRSHQLRYELAHHGCPILGDALYGSKRTFAEGAIALRAISLDLSQCEGAMRFELPARLLVEGLSEVFG